jgi:hypothetical protein
LAKRENLRKRVLDVVNRVTCAERRNVKQEKMRYGAGHQKRTSRRYKGSLENHRHLGKDPCKKDKDKFANFTRRGIANMQTDAISNMTVPVVVNDQKEMEKEKAKAKVKEKEKGVEKEVTKEGREAQFWSSRRKEGSIMMEKEAHQ